MEEEGEGGRRGVIWGLAAVESRAGPAPVGES